MTQYIFIMGATGNVGRTLVSQIFGKGDNDFKMHHNPTKIVGLASSSHNLFLREGIHQESCLQFIERAGTFKEYGALEDLLIIAKEAGYGFERKLVFVDATAADTLDFHLRISGEKMLGLVTANKNPLAVSDYSTFTKLTKDVRKYGYRCSVMAGAEAVSMIQDLRDLRDLPIFVSGCFSGTLGYICSELEKKRNLSEIIREAKENGYTEPHPRDDLNGVDVAKKLLILARTAGYEFNLNDIDVMPFIPKEFLCEDDVNKFINSTAGLDEIFNHKVSKANENGTVLRYVAQMVVHNSTPKLTVSLQEVPKDSSLGSLKGTSNKITVVSRAYPKDNPYIVEAPGAGLQVTAQNIRRDLLYQLDNRKMV